MPSRCPSRRLSVLASALAAVGIVLAGCGHATPLGPDPSPVSLPPAGPLGSPITVQVMRSEQPTATGKCPAGSVSLFGLDPRVPRASVAPAQVQPAGEGSGQESGPGSTVAAPTAAPATSPGSGVPVGVACYVRVGTPVTITSAAVSSVATYPPPASAPKEPATYQFTVAFPAADVPALTALIGQAYDAGDALGMSVAGKLWQAPQPRHKYAALRAAQITLLSRDQALQLYRLLVPSD